MNYQGIEIVCPACHEDLAAVAGNADRLCCTGCLRQFPVIVGIPDLRLRPDPYIGIEKDREKGVDLFERSAGLDFEQTVDLYYRLTREVPPAQAAQFKRGLVSAPARAQEALSRWEREAGPGGDAGRLLDVGCGTAALLTVAAGRYPGVIGVDIAFRWLVVARKRLQEAGLTVPLLCAGVEALPFSGASFDRVVADSVIEHVWDQAAALAECSRVMRPGGLLFVSTPNRFSLGPDPHVPIWAGGLLPERAIAAYARLRGGIPPHRRLLSWRHLRDLIAGAGLGGLRVILPDVPAAQRAQFGAVGRRLIDLYQAVKRLRGGEWLLRWTGPVIQAVSAKSSTPQIPLAKRRDEGTFPVDAH